MSEIPENKTNDAPPLPPSFSLIYTLGIVAMLSGFLSCFGLRIYQAYYC